MLFSCGAIKAGTETVGTPISGSQIVNFASVFVQDNSYPNVEVSGLTKVANASSKVIFSIDNASNLYYNSSNTVKLGLKIYSFDKNGIAQVLPNIIELEVGYSPTGVYKDKSAYVVNGSHKITAVIQYIVDANNVVIPVGSIPQNLRLEVEQTTERYYLFSTSTAPTSVASALIVGTSNELNIHWNVQPGAEEYELEWTYVNDYGETLGAPLPSSSVSCNFRDNSTRVRLSQNHYTISLVFDEGYVVYRVRGIGRPLTDLSKELFGVWSAAESGYVSSYNPLYYHQINPSDRHETSKNWQYSATYAEEGKKKEVVSYFDGSLRNRQSVTKLNTDNKTIVGETIYDYQGRGAIQVLPTPTLESTIKFYPDFNKSTTTGLPGYSRKDFDEDATGSSCDAPTFGMSTTSGSSNYYSSANLNKNGYQSYVPDANLYPFSQIEYTPDNTGRIRRQSGVGKDHQLGSTHETQYFYSQPEQVQLDRLFGSEVGDYKHYKKNMVIDANGQVSVSYLNQEGKVVATSLAGDRPQNVNALPSEGAASTRLTINYIKTNPTPDPLVPNSNENIDNALVFSKELSVATAGNYEFYYDMAAPHFQDMCLPNPICYTCVYDLEISIKDACGLPMIASVSKTIGTFVDGNENENFDTTCGGTTAFSMSPSPVIAFLPVGTYTIYKKLKINEPAIDFYTDNFIANNTCITPYETFLTNALARVDTLACDISCEQCVLSLGDYANHKDSTKSDPLNFASTYDPNYVFYTISEWKRAIKQCNAPCEPANLCEAEYQTLLSDVSPSGQYGKFVIDANGIALSIEPLSVFNSANSLPDGTNAYWRSPKRTGLGLHYYEENGTESKITATLQSDGSYYPQLNFTPSPADLIVYVYPEQLANLIDFINEFGNHLDWAKSLVEYHPEYPYYEWCIKNSTPTFSHTGTGVTELTSDTFDDLLRSKDTYAGAVDPAVGLLDGTNGILDLLNQDPYFSNTTTATPNSGQGVWQKAAMLALLTHYNGSSNPNLKVMCAKVARCGTNYYTPEPPLCGDFGSPNDANGNPLFNPSVIQNQEWILYRNIYLAEKQKLQQKAANGYAISQHNYNGCIGVGTGNYNPWYSGPFSWTNANHDPCGWYTWHLYKNKVKRFQNAGDAMDGVDPFGDQQTAFNTLVNNTEYNMYLETGQCPVTIDLGSLLDNLAQNNSLVSLSSDLIYNPLFTKRLYDALTPILSRTPFIYYNWSSSISGTNTISGLFTGGATSCQLTLTLPGTNIWSDVKRLYNIRFTNESPVGTFNFTIIALLADPNPLDQIPAPQVIVNGSTCINLNTCSFPANCGPSEDALHIQNLFNGLISNSQLLVNDVDLAVAPYDVLYTNNVILPAGVTYTSIKWNGTTSNYGSLDYTFSNGTSNQCDFSFVNSGFVMSDIQYFAHIKPDPTNPTHEFDIDAWVGTQFEPMHVTNVSGCFNFQACTPPANSGCTGAGFENNEGLLAALNTIANQGELLTTFNLSSTLPNFVGLYAVSYPNINNYGSSAEWNFNNVNTSTKEYFATINLHLLLPPVEKSDPITINVACPIYLQFSDLGNTHTYSNIIGFSNLQVSSSGDNSHFTVLATFSDGTSLKLFGSIGCLPLAVCEPCIKYTSVATLMAYNFDGYDPLDPNFDFTSTRTYSPSPACGGPSAPYFNNKFLIGGPGYCANTYPDHNNPGVGNFYYCYFRDLMNGSLLWDKTISGILPNTFYKFSYWVVRGNAITPDEPQWSGSDLQLSIDGVISNTNAPSTTYTWTEVSQIWFSGASPGTVNLKIGSHLQYGTLGLDDIKFEQVEETPCALTPHPTVLVLPYVNPCIKNLIDLATANAHYSYNSYIDSIKADFREKYLSVCKNSLENLKMVYDDKEYHFTLYYYDQAGNLIKTVPPEGVVLVTDPLDFTQIATDRLNKTQTYLTKHTLKTRYEYNSLNQLIRQATPDNALMNKWLMNGVSSLPATTNIYGMAFSSDNNGFVVGDDGSGQGVIYITQDGGQTWSLASSLGVGNLQDVQFIGSTGYAIAENGYLVKTINSGTTWVILPVSETASPVNTQKLNDLYFFSATNGFIIGNNGTIFYTSDGGVTWTVPIISTSSSIGSINLNNIQFLNYDNNKGFIAGNNATVLLTTDGGQTWASIIATNPLNTSIKLNTINFITNSIGDLDGFVAGVDASGNGKIFKATYDPVTFEYTWSNPLNVNASLGCTFNSILVDATTNKGFAAGTNGRMYKTTNGGTIWTQQSITGFSSEITELSVPNFAASPLIAYAVAKNGQYLRLNSSGNWIPDNLTGVSSTAPLNGLYFEPTLPNTGYVAGNGGEIFETTNGGGVWVSLTNVPLPLLNDACLANGTTTGYAVGANGTIIQITNGGNILTPVVHTFITNDMNAVACKDVSNAMAVGDNGAILDITSGTVGSSFLGIENLNDITFLTNSPARYVAVGNGGTIITKNGTSSWVSNASPTIYNLNAVCFVGEMGYIAGDNGTVLKKADAASAWISLTTPASISTKILREIYFKDNLIGYAMGDGGTIIKTIDGGENWIVENIPPPSGTNGDFYASHFTADGHALLGGNTDGNNLAALNDESNDFSSRFWYDRLGRLIVSQNGKQFNKSPKAYSYTKYDVQGRIIEVGETATATDINTIANVHGVIGNDIDFGNWLTTGADHTEITSTLYDDPLVPAVTGFFQENLRKRVSATFIDHNGDGNNEQGSIYSYDIHGNVKTLIQDFTSLGITNSSQRYKRMDYDYDLVSGKVNQVSYQAGQPDQLFHKYEYDADNRITNVITSNDGVIWSNDADYFYYNHGPLARVEIGEQKVQALDYVYTIQGWIKGVNSNTLDPTRDPGKDGITGALYYGMQTDLHSKIGRDAYGYSLSYYDAAAAIGLTPANGNDYTKINTGANYNLANDLIADASASPGYMTDAPNLFNGNIKRMVTTITDIQLTPLSPTYGQAKPQLTAYKYDQLNRIVQMKAYRDITLNTNTFGDGTGNGDLYNSSMVYDANGNILNMNVNGNIPGAGNVEMDNLNYQYDWIDNADHTKGKRSNKLYHVNDNASAIAYTIDIDDQNQGGNPFTPAQPNNLGIINIANNYGYDEIGNLIRDNQEHIGNIEWTVYGKIKKITFPPGFGKNDIVFDYDPSGNRIAKHSNGEDTYYVRDAQGNVMSIYEQKRVTRHEGYTGPDFVAFNLIEQDIYGSSRLGIDNPGKAICHNNVLLTDGDPNLFTHYFGKKNYELSNHLGNVLTVVSDRKIPYSQSGATIDYYLADILSATDYYSFGAPMPGRTFSAESYRYGFNGQEKDDEISGSGNMLAFTFREYDARLGRFFAVDPLTQSYPELTPYQFASNTPIWARELEGLEAWYTNEGNTTSDEFGSGPQNAAAGPMTDEHATELGYTQYGVNETVPDYSFSNAEVKDFSDWNAKKGPTEPGACLGCATTGAEKLTGGDAGFRNSKGNNVLAGKTAYDLGANLANNGFASELPVQMDKETNAMLSNPNAAQTENSAYLAGPAGAYHSILIIHNIQAQTFSIFDQGTGWDVKNATQKGAQSQISDINSVHPNWGSRVWQLNKTKTVERRYQIGQ
ncbi:MAG: hypothetical protein A3F72_01650 [Bacteroidetes bacterium RIFCSPLOWO2_12_FULL_35_15]|nr:MAG: hypothetical protein A3F72_01650 [Bacteroidetes bacterium RIFCSPLOWO2_12_FULL_35_15]